ncbi:hypothetical protein B0T18DRAFT_4415 [Schizothecium vesticola]|uniref:Uncharacterized protein n=1 Tax=Schizothecium vesticola TaxID=314040 RepID=A0AA40F8G4_9PEZI|nr:hypothetical protein B0T18DRAFT_4415 [Schizothecium vesticola]
MENMGAPSLSLLPLLTSLPPVSPDSPSSNHIHHPITSRNQHSPRSSRHALSSSCPREASFLNSSARPNISATTKIESFITRTLLRPKAVHAKTPVTSANYTANPANHLASYANTVYCTSIVPRTNYVSPAGLAVGPPARIRSPLLSLREMFATSRSILYNCSLYGYTAKPILSPKIAAEGPRVMSLSRVNVVRALYL